MDVTDDGSLTDVRLVQPANAYAGIEVRPVAADKSAVTRSVSPAITPSAILVTDELGVTVVAPSNDFVHTPS